MLASHPPRTKPAPNFFSTHSVLLPVDIQTAYRVLGTAAGHERVCRLSKLCTDVDMLEKDEVTLPVPDYPEGRRLGKVGVREAPASTTSSNDRSTSKTGVFKTLTRQHFVLEKVIPIIFGLFKKKLKIVGTLTWDNSILSPHTAPSASSSEPVETLHESISDPNGIVVWKLRTFETVEDDSGLVNLTKIDDEWCILKFDRTRVTERIEGWAPALLRPIVQNVFTAEHHAHMKLYHTLF